MWKRFFDILNTEKKRDLICPVPAISSSKEWFSLDRLS